MKGNRQPSKKFAQSGFLHIKSPHRKTDIGIVSLEEDAYTAKYVDWKHRIVFIFNIYFRLL
jgi:hypothetical protein